MSIGLWLWVAIAAVGSLGACDGCRKQRLIEKIDRWPYPTCRGKALPEGVEVAKGHLRAGPILREQHLVEHFSIRKRGCVWSINVRQEWSRGVADVEVIYDENLKPLRAWKRMTLPGVERSDGMADIRLYELRRHPVIYTHRYPDGRLEYKSLEGDRPIAVIGPGRGLLPMWIKKAALKVGAKQRGPVLDFRGLEQIKTVTLRRDSDRSDLSLGGDVRVYTVYGRESVFADHNDVVVGDLAGLRPHHLLKTPPPPALPQYGNIDPINTP